MTRFFPLEAPFDDRTTIFLHGVIDPHLQWRHEAMELIEKLDPGLSIANPYLVGQEQDAHSKKEHLHWQDHYLRKAQQFGAVLFWFPVDSEYRCHRDFLNRAILELGKWLYRMDHDANRVVVGGKLLTHSFTQTRHPKLVIYQTLPELCQAAVTLARSPIP